MHLFYSLVVLSDTLLNKADKATEQERRTATRHKLGSDKVFAMTSKS